MKKQLLLMLFIIAPIVIAISNNAFILPDPAYANDTLKLYINVTDYSAYKYIWNVSINNVISNSGIYYNASYAEEADDSTCLGASFDSNLSTIANSSNCLLNYTSLANTETAFWQIKYLETSAASAAEQWYIGEAGTTPQNFSTVNGGQNFWYLTKVGTVYNNLTYFINFCGVGNTSPNYADSTGGGCSDPSLYSREDNYPSAIANSYEMARFSTTETKNVSIWFEPNHPQQYVNITVRFYSLSINANQYSLKINIINRTGASTNINTTVGVNNTLLNITYANYLMQENDTIEFFIYRSGDTGSHGAISINITDIDFNATQDTTQNFTLPQTCIAGDAQLSVSYDSTNGTSFNCYNGTAFQNVSTLNNVYSFYEEGIWRLSNISNTNYNVLNLTGLIKDKTYILRFLPASINDYAWNETNYTITILNSIPIINNASITPVIAYANDTLLGYCNASDIDNDFINYNYTWYLNNAVNITFSSIYSSALINDIYQENYNETDCISSGHAELVDGNWNSFSNMESATCFVNYTKPTNAINATWIVKDDGYPALYVNATYSCVDTYSNCTYNITLPDACFDADANRLLLNPDEPGGELWWKCYNGTAWQTLLYTESGGNMYEEAIVWGMSQPIISAGQNWTFSCQANDSTNVSEWYNSSIATIQDFTNATAPVIISASINVTTAYVGNTLFGYCKASDVNGDNLTYNYIWYLNNVLNVSGTSNNFTQNTEQYISNVTGLIKNQNWTFSCQANDTSNLTSAWLNSSVLTISNSLPISLTPKILPTIAYYNSTLLGYCNASDSDNDELFYNYRWYLNNNLFVNGTEYLYIYQEDANQTTCADNACDGNWSNFASISSPIYINYTIPNGILGAFWELGIGGSTQNFSIANTCITGKEKLEARVVLTGIYGNYAYLECKNSTNEWRYIYHYNIGNGLREEAIIWFYKFNQSAEQLLYSMNQAYIESGQNWTFSCQANDTNDISSWINSSSIVITNIVPTIISARITPAIAYYNNPLVGYCNSTQSDNYTIGYDYVWYLNNILNVSGSINLHSVFSEEDAATYIDLPLSINTEYNVSKVFNIRGRQNWTFSCQANDTLNVSAVLNTSIYISNTAPIINYTAITPSPTNQTDNVTCNVTYFEPDEDNITLIYNWTIDGTLTAEHNLTLNFNNLTGKINISCSAFANDETANTSWSVSPLVTFNDVTKPVLTYSLQASSGYTDTSFYVFANCSDSQSGIQPAYPKVSFIDPDNILQGNYSMTLNSSGIYYYYTTFSKVGTYTNFSFYCYDAQGNLNSSANIANFSFISSTRPAAASGGGGGVVVVSSAAVKCNWTLNNNKIVLYTGEAAKRLLLTNNEDFSITPTYTLSGDLFKVAGIQNIIAKKSKNELTILRDPSVLKSGNTAGNLTISSDKCLPITLAVEFVNEYSELTLPDTLNEIFKSSVGKITSKVDFFGLNINFYWIVAVICVIVFFIVRNSNTSLAIKITSGIIMIVLISILLAIMFNNTDDNATPVLAIVNGTTKIENMSVEQAETPMDVASNKTSESVAYTASIFNEDITSTNIGNDTVHIKYWMVFILLFIVICGIMFGISNFDWWANILISFFVALVLIIVTYLFLIGG